MKLTTQISPLLNFYFQYYGPQCKNDAAYVLIVGNVVVALTVIFSLAFQWFYPTGPKAKLMGLAAMLLQLLIFIWGGVLVFGKPFKGAFINVTPLPLFFTKLTSL